MVIQIILKIFLTPLSAINKDNNKKMISKISKVIDTVLKFLFTRFYFLSWLNIQ